MRYTITITRTDKPADPPNDHVVRVKLTDGLIGYVDDFGRVYENPTNADWYTAERAAAIAARVSGPMLHRAEAVPLPEHGNDDDDEPIAWLDIAKGAPLLDRPLHPLNE